MDISEQKIRGTVKKSIQTPGASVELIFDGKSLLESCQAEKGIFQTQQYDWQVKYSPAVKSEFHVQGKKFEQTVELKKYQHEQAQSIERSIHAEQAIYRSNFEEDVEINEGELNIKVPHQLSISTPKRQLNVQQMHQISQQIEISANQILLQAEHVSTQFQTHQIEAKEVRMSSKHRTLLPPASMATSNISLLSFKHPIFNFEQIKAFIPELPSYGLKALLNQYPKDQSQWVYEQLVAHVQQNYPETDTSLNQIDLKNIQWPRDAIERQLLQLRVSRLKSWL